MRLLDLVAVPHPSGNRIDLSWVHPSPTNSPACASCVVSAPIRFRLRLTSSQQGVVVADTEPTSPSHSRIQVR